MLDNYSVIKPILDAKTRGRKHEFKLNNSPELWVSYGGYNGEIVVYFPSGGHVCTLMPDNGMRIMFGGWHTQTTTKIIGVLSGQTAWLRDNHIWFESLPVDGGVLYFDSNRKYIPPKKYLDLQSAVYVQLQKVTLPPEARLRLEIGAWKVKPAVTQRVKDYALGKISMDKLGDRDLVTCMKIPDQVTHRLLEEAA